MNAEPSRCNSTLGGRAALQHACTFEPGHKGRCSWWDWHQEQVARHEHARRWRNYLNPPQFQLQDYRGFLADRLTGARARATRHDEQGRDTGHER
jgi:hypothetical protein